MKTLKALIEKRAALIELYNGGNAYTVIVTEDGFVRTT